MPLDNLEYHGGLMLKRAIERTGRTPSLSHYAVALWLKAQEDGADLEALVHKLIQAKDYDPAANKLDKDARIKSLGF